MIDDAAGRRRRLGCGRSTSSSTTDRTNTVTCRARVVGWLTTTDHKALGVAYFVTSMVFLAIGGALAGVIRAELARARPAGRERADLQRRVHHPRQRDGVPVRRAVRVRARELPRAAADRRARPGLPPAQRVLVLAVRVRRRGDAARLRHRRRSGRRSAGSPIPPLSGAAGSPGIGGDLWIISVILDRHVGHADRGQRHRHHHVDAGTRHDDVPDADPGVEPARHQLHGAARVPGAVRGAADARGRPPVRHPLLRPDQGRLADPVAAPVLVLRPPRGVHRGAAVLRRRHRDLPGVRPPPGVRVQGPDPRHAHHRRAVDVGVGAPHVRHRLGRAAVLRRSRRCSSPCRPASRCSTGSARCGRAR